MSIVTFKDYRKFVKSEIRKMPRAGHGQLLKLSQALGVHTTMITHVLSGKANFSVEQGLKVARFLGLREIDTDYFINLVLFDRAGDAESRRFFQEKLDSLRHRILDVREPQERKKELSEADQNVFYANWYTSAVRLMTAIDGYQTPSAIADELGLSTNEVGRILRFLVSVGLCEESDGFFRVAIQQTFVPKDIATVYRHHQNWRLKAIENYGRSGPDDLSFTNPVVISREDFIKVRDQLVEFIKTFQKTALPSPSEELCCLTIDWIKIAPK